MTVGRPFRPDEGADERLRVSEERFRTIFENAPIMIDSFDANGRCLLWNKECERNLGWTRAEVIASDDPLALAYPDPVVRDRVIETIRRADGKFREYEVRAKDGSLRTQLWADFRLPDGTLISVGHDITERKLAEKSLAESEAKYRSIFSEALDGIVLADRDGFIIDCNPEFERQTGRTLDELRNMHVWELRPARDREKAARLFHSLWERGVASSREQRFEKPDGGLIDIELRGRTVTVGNLQFSQAITRDITRRRQTERALREGDARLRLIIQQVPAVLWTTDRELRFTSSQGIGLRSIGRKPNEVVGMSLYEYFQSDDPEFLPIAMHRRALEGESVTYTTVWEETVFECHTEPLRDEGGAIIGCVGIALDVTERLRAIEDLQRSEERYSKLFHFSNDGVFVYKFDGRIIDVNEKAVEQFGYTKSELLGMRIKDLVPQEWRSVLASKLDDLRRDGFVRLELLVKTKEGGEFLSEVSGSVVRIGDREVIQGIVRDITERKRAEEQLRALAVRLQSVREEESTIISRDIHDELGQTLTGLKMDVAWIQRRIAKGGFEEEMHQINERLKAMSTDIDETVQAVRRISTRLRPGILDDLGLLGALEWQAQEFEGRTGIRCRFAAATTELALDRDRSTAVFRIFQEILTNIARHARADEVDIRLKADKDMLVMDVVDNGRGISKDEMNSSRALGILGMQERAQVCGGRVRIEPESGMGTRVAVKIPMT